MNSLLLAVLTTAVGALIGNVYRRSLAAKTRYYAEYTRFLRYAAADVACRRTSVPALAATFDTPDPNFSAHLREWTEGLKNDSHKLSRGCLSAAEADAVGQTLFSIGRVDAETQLRQLQLAADEAAASHSAAAGKQDKYGNLAVKLGLLAGLAVGILLL